MGSYISSTELPFKYQGMMLKIRANICATSIYINSIMSHVTNYKWSQFSKQMDVKCTNAQMHEI